MLCIYVQINHVINPHAMVDEINPHVYCFCENRHMPILISLFQWLNPYGKLLAKSTTSIQALNPSLANPSISHDAS